MVLACRPFRVWMIVPVRLPRRVRVHRHGPPFHLARHLQRRLGQSPRPGRRLPPLALSPSYSPSYSPSPNIPLLISLLRSLIGGCCRVLSFSLALALALSASHRLSCCPSLSLSLARSLSLSLSCVTRAHSVDAPVWHCGGAAPRWMARASA